MTKKVKLIGKIHGNRFITLSLITVGLMLLVIILNKILF